MYYVYDIGMEAVISLHPWIIAELTGLIQGSTLHLCLTQSTLQMRRVKQ